MNTISLDLIDACNICGHDKAILISRVHDIWFNLPGEFLLVKCQNCHQVYLTPQPPESEIQLYYPDEYPPFKKDTLKLQKIWDCYLWLFRADIHYLRGIAPGKLLDIGCGSGEYLQTMKQKGWKVVGLDVSSKAVETARAKGLDVRLGSLDKLEFAKNEFDAITLIHSLEHMSSPSSTLGVIKKILKDSGLLIIEVPNYGGVESRIFKRYWRQLDVPRHLFHFTFETLRNLLHMQGFYIEQVGYNPSPIHITASLNFVFQKKLSWITKNSKARYLAYIFLPLSSFLAAFGLGSSLIVKSRKQ